MLSNWHGCYSYENLLAVVVEFVSAPSKLTPCMGDILNSMTPKWFRCEAFLYKRNENLAHINFKKFIILAEFVHFVVGACILFYFLSSIACTKQPKIQTHIILMVVENELTVIFYVLWHKVRSIRYTNTMQHANVQIRMFFFMSSHNCDSYARTCVFHRQNTSERK